MRSGCGMRQAYADALLTRPVLHTPRLVLRTPTEADIPAIVAIAGDWEVARRLGRMPHPYGEPDARFFLDLILPAELAWAIVERGTGRMIGMAGLAPKPDTVELGYYVARDRWGEGVATEAAAVVAAFASGLVGQRSLRSSCFFDNPASGRVLEKLGFVPLHRSERPCLAMGGPRPCIEFGFAPQVTPLQSAGKHL